MNEKNQSMGTRDNRKSILTPKSQKGRKKSKKRFTVLDFFLVVIVVLCILGIGFRDVIADAITQAEPTEKVRISFFADGLTENELAKLGESQRFQMDGEDFGLLVDYSSEPSKVSVEKLDDEGNIYYETVTESGYYSVSGTLLVDIRYAEGGPVSAENVSLYVGKILNIYSSSLSITVTITEIPRK